MKKQERQNLIRTLLTDRKISRQEELTAKLSEMGVDCNQATVSRDLRELNVEKVNDGENSYYAIRTSEKKPDYSSLAFITKVECANNILVIHTQSGMANAVAVVLDNASFPEILGTVAGDNTILMVARGNEEAESIRTRILNIK